MRMHAANNQTNHGVPNGRARGRTEGAEGVCNPTERKTILTNQTPQSFQRVNLQPKSTLGGTHGRWPCWASMGGEALGPMEA